jgi:hypothetical protein
MNPRLTSHLCRASIVSAIAIAAGAFAQATAAPTTKPSAAPAQTKEPLPSAAEVFANAVKAIGGADIIRQQSARTQVGAVEMPAQNLKGTIVTRSVAPDYLLVETEIPGFGKIFQGMNKSVGWTIDPMRGPSLMTTEELAQVKREASTDAELNPGTGFDSVAVVDKVAFNGVPCFKVKFVKGATESFKYYAVDSGLLTGSEDTVDSALGPMRVVSLYKDYTDFSGRKIARVLEATTMGQVQRVTIDTIDFAPVDLSVFALPAEIQALADAQKSAPSSPSAPATPSHTPATK